MYKDGVNPELFVGRILGNVVDGMINNYAELIYGAFEGDGQAAGELLFEALSFYAPGMKGAPGGRLSSKVDDFVKAFKEATEAIRSGGRQFRVMDDVVINTNRGLTWIEGTESMSTRAANYQNGTTGASSNVASQKAEIPALRYTNPNPNGVNYVKFDGYDDITFTLIDRKINVTNHRKSIDQVRRMSEALRQNPAFNAVIEVPNQKIQRKALRLLEKAGVDNISVRIAPE